MTSTPLTLSQALIATLVMALIIFATRAFPFVLFSKREPPRILQFIEKYIPPMVMAILIIYSIKSVQFAKAPHGIPELAAIAVTVLLHLWKNNSMVSIFGGTALYMVLNYVL